MCSQREENQKYSTFPVRISHWNIVCVCVSVHIYLKLFMVEQTLYKTLMSVKIVVGLVSETLQSLSQEGVLKIAQQVVCLASVDRRCLVVGKRQREPHIVPWAQGSAGGTGRSVICDLFQTFTVGPKLHALFIPPHAEDSVFLTILKEDPGTA